MAPRWRGCSASCIAKPGEPRGESRPWHSIRVTGAPPRKRRGTSPTRVQAALTPLRGVLRVIFGASSTVSFNVAESEHRTPSGFQRIRKCEARRGTRCRPGRPHRCFVSANVGLQVDANRTLEFCYGSASAGPTRPAKGGYAAHSGRTPVRPGSCGLPIDGEDACRPVPVLRQRPVSGIPARADTRGRRIQ